MAPGPPIGRPGSGLTLRYKPYAGATSGPPKGRPGSGIRRTPPSVTAPPAPKPGGGQAVGGYASSAEAEADRIIAELLAELGLTRDSARREAERTAQSEIARAQALSQALVSLGIPAQIQGIYSNAGANIAGLAQGFSGDVQALANQQGAQQANMVAGTGQEGAVRNEGAAMGNVLYGLEGMIPARSLEQMGAAFSAEAALQPGFTQQFGQIAASKVMDDFVKEALPEFTAKEAEIRTKRPSLVADAKERRRQETFQLYEAGLLTQREMAKRLGLPNWRKFPNVLPGSEQERPKASASLSKAVGYLVDEYGNPILNTKGKPIPLPKDPAKIERFGSASGGYWAMNPETGEIINLIPPQAKQYAPKGYQLKTMKDGSTAVFDPNTGQTTVIAPPPKGSKKPKTLTPAQRAKYTSRATRFARDMLNGWVDEDTGEQVPPRSLGEALELLREQDIPWNLGRSIVYSYYKKHYKGPIPPPGYYSGKGRPAKGGDKKDVSFNQASLAPSLHGLFGYALSQGFTNLGSHNPDSRLPGGGVSDHAKWPAEAFDIGGFSGGWGNAKARRMFQWLIKQPGVKYVILGDKIWSRGRGLHAYTAGGHDTHIHVSGYGSSV